MKNIGNIAGKAAVALSFLNLGASAKAMEEYNEAELKTKTELANFDTKLKKESVSNKAKEGVSNKVIDTLNPAKSAAKETLNADPTPEQIAAAEILTNKFAELTRKQTNEYLTQNSADLDKKVLEIVVVNLDKRWDEASRLANLYSDEATTTSNVYSDEDQAAKQQKYFEKSDTYKAEYGRLSDVIYEIKQAILKFNIPTAEDMKGITDMTPIFDSILKNPKYAGTIKNNPELNKEIFAGFSKEFQEVFLSMNIKIAVKKYPEKIKVYFEYGTDKDGEVAKVQFMDSKWEKSPIYVLDVADVEKVLSTNSSSDGQTMIQQIREKNGIIENRTLQKDGRISFSNKADKNKKLTNTVASN
jgi:hypothetical protein